MTASTFFCVLQFRIHVITYSNELKEPPLTLSLDVDVITYPRLTLNVLLVPLTHWGRETHICVGKWTIIVSDNGLSPGRRQAIIWTNAGILLIGPLGTNFNEILIEIQTFSFKKMHLKMSSAKWRPFCLGLNVLIFISKRSPWTSPRKPFAKLIITR